MTVSTPTRITNSRDLKIERVDSTVEWTVNEFDGGERFMLIVHGANGGINFSAHFTGEQWAAFQALIGPAQ